VVLGDKILQDHAFVLITGTFDISGHVFDDYELPYLYWIPRLHRTPYKERYVTGTKTFSTKPLSILLTKIFTAGKKKLQMHCSTVYARSGVNQMWILKYSKELLESLKSSFFLKFKALNPIIFNTL
jgi:hypothetical protein